MTSVGSVDPPSAGNGFEPVVLDGSISASRTDASPAGVDHAELLIGFLTDFHAAAREPAVPEPPKPVPAQNGKLPSRFAAFVPPELDVLAESADPLSPPEPLPVWPPPPAPVGADPKPSVDGDQPKKSRLGRLGRRG